MVDAAGRCAARPRRAAARRLHPPGRWRCGIHAGDRDLQCDDGGTGPGALGRRLRFRDHAARRRSRRDADCHATRPKRARRGTSGAHRDRRGRCRAADTHGAPTAIGGHGHGSGSAGVGGSRATGAGIPGSRASSPFPQRDRRATRGVAGNCGGDTRQRSAVCRHGRMGPARVHGRGPGCGACGSKPVAQPGGDSSELLRDLRDRHRLGAGIHEPRSVGRAKRGDRQRGRR